LAKIAAAMAAKGGFDGVQLLSEPTFDAAHSDVVQKYDDILLEESRFAQGGFAEFRLGEHTDRILSEGRGSLLGGSNMHPRAWRIVLWMGWLRWLCVHLEPAA
jgi:hypothetical protein